MEVFLDRLLFVLCTSRLSGKTTSFCSHLWQRILLFH